MAVSSSATNTTSRSAATASITMLTMNADISPTNATCRATCACPSACRRWLGRYAAANAMTRANNTVAVIPSSAAAASIRKRHAEPVASIQGTSTAAPGASASPEASAPARARPQRAAAP